MNIVGKNVVITGASKGIGKALAQSFVTKGAHVFVLDIMPCDIPEVTFIKTDITSSSSVSHAIGSIENIDILINNAGIMRRGNLFENSEQDFDELFAVNLKGPWLVLNKAITKMSPQGIVLQIASNHVIKESSDPALYTISKTAVATLNAILQKTKSELLCKTAYLGHVDTDLGRFHLTEKQIEEKNKEAQPIDVVIQKLFELLVSNAKTLKYMHPNFIFE